MKTFLVTQLILIATQVLLSSFINDKNLSFKVYVDNIADRELKKVGIKPVDFADLKISPTDESIQVETIKITLARGNRAIEISTVNSNHFNLGKYKGVARAGDRIVIEVRMLNKSNELLDLSNAIIVMTVN